VDETIPELVRRAQRGDAAAFSRLIRRYERTALAVAYSQTGDGDLAGEAVQEAFLRAWQRIRSLKDPACFGPWLVQIVQRCAVDQRRQMERRRDADVPAEVAEQAADPVAELRQRELRERISAALAELDETSRTAVALRYYEGLSSREIGQLLELSPAAIDMRLSRARQQLREILEAERA